MANTVKLQGIYGQQAGTAVKNLNVGDVIVWNFGYKSEVAELIPSKTGKTITVMLKCFESGNISHRKMVADRLVVVEQKKKPTNEVENALGNLNETYNGIYSDVGLALDKFSTEELAEYYINVLGCGSSLRYYLEQQITAAEISKRKTV